MPEQCHGHPLADPRADEVARRRPAQVVGPKQGRPAFFTALRHALRNDASDFPPRWKTHGTIQSPACSIPMCALAARAAVRPTPGVARRGRAEACPSSCPSRRDGSRRPRNPRAPKSTPALREIANPLGTAFGRSASRGRAGARSPGRSARLEQNPVRAFETAMVGKGGTSSPSRHGTQARTSAARARARSAPWRGQHPQAVPNVAAHEVGADVDGVHLAERCAQVVQPAGNVRESIGERWRDSRRGACARDRRTSSARSRPERRPRPISSSRLRSSSTARARTVDRDDSRCCRPRHQNSIHQTAAASGSPGLGRWSVLSRIHSPESSCFHGSPTRGRRFLL